MDKLITLSDRELSNDDIVSFALGGDNEALQIYKTFGCDDFNSRWMYLSDDIKLKYLTNETGQDAIHHVNKRALRKVNDSMYKNIKKYDIKQLILETPKLTVLNLPTIDDINTDNNNKTYTICTGECFKLLLMLSKTKAGQKVREYFIKIEYAFKLMSEYATYITNRLLDEQRRELEHVKQQLICNKNKYESTIKRTKDICATLPDTIRTPGYFYIVKSADVSKNFIVKLGKTIDINSRLSQYHTTDKSIVLLYKWEVADVHTTERIILDLLSDISINKGSEWHYCYDETKMINDIDTIIKLVNSIISTDRVNIIRIRYINEQVLHIPSITNNVIRSRSLSPKKKNVYKAEIDTYKSNKNIKRLPSGLKEQLTSILENGGKIV